MNSFNNLHSHQDLVAGPDNEGKKTQEEIMAAEDLYTSEDILMVRSKEIRIDGENGQQETAELI